MDRETADDIKRHFEVVADGLRDEIGLLRTEVHEVRRHSDVIAESLRSEIRLVAEGVAGLDEKFTKGFVTVREEMREQFGEMKSLFRASYGDLDRRVQALETKPS